MDIAAKNPKINIIFGKPLYEIDLLETSGWCSLGPRNPRNILISSGCEGRIFSSAFTAPQTSDANASKPKSSNFLLFISMFVNRDASYAIRGALSDVIGELHYFCVRQLLSLLQRPLVLLGD